MSKEHKHIEGTGRPLKVVAPVKGLDITKGKEYYVVGYWSSWDDEYGNGFKIVDDSGYKITAAENKSPHIYYKNWIVKERPFRG